MLKLIKKVDLYSHQAHFTLNDEGDQGLKTILGGIISLFLIIIVSSFGLYFISRLLLKNDESIIYYSIRDNSVNITYSYSLPFMFRISDTFSIPIENDGLYNISLLIWFANSSNLGKNDFKQYYDSIYIEKCDINKHFGNYINYFKNMNDINTYFCPSFRLKNQSLNGIYGNNEPFVYYNFYFSKCINDTKFNSCKNDNYIYEILSDAYLDLRYIDYSINNLNKKNVAQIKVRNERFILSISVYKRIWLYIKKISYLTDYGLFYHKYTNETFHQYDSIRIDSDLRDLSFSDINGTFTSITISNSGTVDIYKRNYLKFQDYLATIGGIAKALSIFCYSLNYFNAKNSYYKKIIKDFIIENQVEKKKKNINYKNNNFNSTTSRNQLFSNGIKNSNTYNISNNSNLNNNNFLNQKQYSFNNFLQNYNNFLRTNNKKEKKKVNNKNNKNNYYDKGNKKTISLIPLKMKEKERFEKKYSGSFLPIQFKNWKIKDEFNQYIKMINKRLNIIHVLAILEHFKNLDHLNTNSNFLSDLSHSIEIKNYFQDFKKFKK